MGKTIYDIVHVEDDDFTRQEMKRAVEETGLTYLGLSSLQGLESALLEAEGKIFLIDGSFPRIERGENEVLGGEAADISKKYCKNARIIIHTLDPGWFIELREKYEVLCKVDYLPLSKFVKEVIQK